MQGPSGMKTKDMPRREPCKEPKEDVIKPTREERERARIIGLLRDSDRIHAAYLDTLDPRERERLAPWAP